MEKEFVTYEIALALKELGFDKPCFFAFDNCSTPMRCSDLRTNEQKFYGVNYNSSTYTSQPTFSQAFRWFREKHNLCGEVYTVNMGAIDYSFQIRDLYSENYIHDNFEANTGGYIGTFLTYEEAELDCLIKLIEIVESKTE